jgi:D-alanyl-D-alanine carboxypeptidase
VLSTLVIALAIQPATTWSQTQPPFPPPFPPETQAALQQIVEQQLAEAGTPGVLVGVWIPGRGTWVHAQGTGDVATGAPIRVSDTVRVGSIAKTFTATVLLQLVDEGRLRLDDRLEQYVPGVPNSDRITIRQVLGMTAGIFSYTADATFQAEYEANPLMPFSLEELLVILRRHPPAFPPGESVQYSDTNYYLLGLIVEQLTGQRVGEAIDQRILQPLRLTGTSYPTTPDMPEPYAHGYNAEPGGALRDVTRSNPAVAEAAGAMLSTLDDLRLWTEALVGGVLLSPTTQRERLQWSPFPGGEAFDYRYGLGIMAYDGLIGHSGGIVGYESLAFHLPEANATLVVLGNKSGLFGGGAAAPIFFDIAGLLFPERFPQPAATARGESAAPVQAQEERDPGPWPASTRPVGQDIPYAYCSTADTGTTCLFLGTWPSTPNDAVLLTCPPGASLITLDDASHEVRFSADSCAEAHFPATPSIISSARPRAFAAYALRQRGIDPTAANPLVDSCLAQSHQLLDALLPTLPGVTSFDELVDRIEQGMDREIGDVLDRGLAACPSGR